MNFNLNMESDFFSAVHSENPYFDPNPTFLQIPETENVLSL